MEKEERESFFDPDEKLKDWDFDGLQMEKHSKSAHAEKRKREKDHQKEPAAEEKQEENGD